jgi:phospholipase/carboxylesterase
MTREIAQAADRVAALATSLARTKPTKGKPVITGFSQGGFLSFAVALRHPDAVAAAYPISGAVPPNLLPTEHVAKGSHPPIVALHGDADRLVPIAPARTAIRRLQELGFDAELLEYPGVGHTVTSSMSREVASRIARTITP